MSKITVSEQFHWQKQALADALDWHRANMMKRLTPELEKAFEAGFNQGFSEAFSLIRLHGGQVETQKEENKRRHG